MDINPYHSLGSATDWGRNLVLRPLQDNTIPLYLHTVILPTVCCIAICEQQHLAIRHCWS